MYRLINQNIAALPDSINPQIDIQLYVWLLETLSNVEVATWISMAEMRKQLGVCPSVIAKSIREKEGGKDLGCQFSTPSPKYTFA